MRISALMFAAMLVFCSAPLLAQVSAPVGTVPDGQKSQPAGQVPDSTKTADPICPPPVVQTTGPKGDTGAQGAQGLQGPRGSRGARGPSGSARTERDPKLAAWLKKHPKIDAYLNGETHDQKVQWEVIRQSRKKITKLETDSTTFKEKTNARLEKLEAGVVAPVPTSAVIPLASSGLSSLSANTTFVGFITLCVIVGGVGFLAIRSR